MEIRHTQLHKLIKRCYETKTPLDIKGGIGIGKSYVGKKVAQEIAKEQEKEFFEWNERSQVEKEELLTKDLKKTFIFADIRLIYSEPTDLKGMPNVTTEITKWIPNLLWKVISNPDSDGIVFFDEANLVSPSISSAMYQIINDKQCGELPLSKKILYISAGNRTEDNCNVFDESNALKNRRLNVILAPPTMNLESQDDWGKWAMKNNILPQIIGFLYWKPSYLYNVDIQSKDDCIPTPRMWTMTSKMITEIENYDDIKLYLGNSVGEGIALEYIAFLKLKDKIDLKDLLKNPEKMSQIKELDMKFSIVSGLSELYMQNNKILNECLGLCKHMEPEFSMFLLRILKERTKNDFAIQLIKCPNWETIGQEYKKYLI